MAFRYVNPGLVSLLDSNVTATQYTGYEYSRTGYAFTQTNSNAGVTIPQFKQGDDFWARFDFYITGQPNITLHVPNSRYFEIAIWGDTLSGYFVVSYGSGSSDRDYFVYNSKLDAWVNFNALNTFWAHVVYGGAETASVEVILNGKRVTSSGWAIPYSAQYYPKKVLLYGFRTGVQSRKVI